MSGWSQGEGLLAEASTWGPWRHVIEDAVAACTVRVRRLGESLGPGVRLTRAEFRAEAAYLYELADELVERCDDVGRWLEVRENSGGIVNGDEEDAR